MRVLLAAALLQIGLLNASPIYRLVDLGSLGGTSAAAAINSMGVAVGRSQDRAGFERAFESSGAGGIRALDATRPGQATGIDDSGRTVGIRFDVYGNAEAVMWLPGGEAVMIGGANSYAMAINASGLAVGANGGRAVRFSEGGPVDMGLDAPWSSANAVNEAGAVAGTAQRTDGRFRAFVSENGGGVTMLGALGGLHSYGHALNDSGWVAGASTTARGYLHAFLYANGSMQDLGTLGGTNSGAYGVNEWGQVVGYSRVASGESSAFLFENGQMRDLNELIAGGAGWRLLEASAINDNGQIVGFGEFGGVERAFRLDPIGPRPVELSRRRETAAVPEPGGLLPAAIGIAAVAFGAIRRREPGEPI